MATREMAQDILCCDLCNTSTVQMHCNRCAINLCNDCTIKHITSDTTVAHEVVIFKMRNKEPVYFYCPTHTKHKCEMFCCDCDTPLCNKCIASGSHKKHELQEMLDIFNKRKQSVEKETEQLEKSIYPRHKKAIEDVEKKIERLPENYEKVITAISQHGAEWHDEIDKIIKKLKENVEKMKVRDEDVIKSHLAKMKTFLSDLHQAIVSNKNLLKSNNIEKMTNYKFIISKYTDPTPMVNVTPPTFSPFLLHREQLQQMFGTLNASVLQQKIHTKYTDKISSDDNISSYSSMSSMTNYEDETSFQTQNIPSDLLVLSLKKAEEVSLASSLIQKLPLDSSKVLKSIDTKYDELRNIACLGQDEIWVSGNNENIKCFNLEGNVQKTVMTATGYPPNGITLTSRGYLVYTDNGDNSINIIKNGRIEKQIKIEGWKPDRVCSTAGGDLLVIMHSYTKPSKVVRYSGSTEKQVIQYNKNHKPLFSSATYFFDKNMFIAEDTARDMICVSDSAAEKVIVFTQTGELRFSYTGNNLSKKCPSFYPTGLVIDTNGHILVAELKNHCIHIIDQQGQFINYIKNCQLDCPYDLALYENDTLFVVEKSNSKLKIIKYLK